MNLSSAPGSLFLSGCLKCRRQRVRIVHTWSFYHLTYIAHITSVGKVVCLALLPNGRNNQLLHMSIKKCNFNSGNFLSRCFSWTHFQSARERRSMLLRRGDTSALILIPQHCESRDHRPVRPHPAPFILCCCFETGSLYVALAVLELSWWTKLTSNSLRSPASAPPPPPSTGIKGMSHQA